LKKELRIILLWGKGGVRKESNKGEIGYSGGGLLVKCLYKGEGRINVDEGEERNGKSIVHWGNILKGVKEMRRGADLWRLK